MAIKHDFTKHMKNRSATHQIPEKSNARSDRFESVVQIAPKDKVRLESFSKQETAYYNSLVNLFSSRTRAFPETILGLTDAEIKLYLDIAKYGIPVTPILRSGNRDSVPAVYEKYTELLFGKKENPSKMSFEKSSVLDISSSPATLIPEIRVNMAKEMLEHYTVQCNKITASVPASQDSAYREPVELLTELNFQQKRHVQIPKSCLSLKWDDENKQTLIWCQYFTEAVVLKDTNLLAMHDWNYIILHQDNIEKITPMTPWVINLRKIKHNYLIKMIDSPGSWRSKIFQEAKKRSH